MNWGEAEAKRMLGGHSSNTPANLRNGYITERQL